MILRMGGQESGETGARCGGFEGREIEEGHLLPGRGTPFPLRRKGKRWPSWGDLLGWTLWRSWASHGQCEVREVSRKHFMGGMRDFMGTAGLVCLE